MVCEEKKHLHLNLSLTILALLRLLPSLWERVINGYDFAVHKQNRRWSLAQSSICIAPSNNVIQQILGWQILWVRCPTLTNYRPALLSTGRSGLTKCTMILLASCQILWLLVNKTLSVQILYFGTGNYKCKVNICCYIEIALLLIPNNFDTKD